MKPTLTLSEVAVLMRLSGQRVERKALRRLRAIEARQSADAPRIVTEHGSGTGRARWYTVDSAALERAAPHLFYGAPAEREERERVSSTDARFEAYEARLRELHDRDEALVSEVVALRRRVAAMERNG